MSGRRAKSIRGGRGEQVSRRRATVSNGGQRAVEEKVEKRDLEIGGDPIAPSHTSRLRRFLARPTVHLPSGRAYPAFSSFFLRRPSTRSRPSRVRPPHTHSGIGGASDCSSPSPT